MNPFEALEALRGANRRSNLGKLYDEDERVASAALAAWKDFEYPDHSWKTVGAFYDSALRRADPNAVLWAEVCAGNDEGIAKALALGADPNARYPGDARPTLVGQAAFECRPKALRRLAKLGADASIPDDWGRPPLHMALFGAASEREKAEVLKALVDRGAPVDGRDNSGRAALAHAARLGFAEAASILLSRGADPNAQGQDGQGPLHWAATRNHILVAKALLAAGADPNLAEEAGRTPMHWAGLNGSATLCGALAKAGANLDARDSLGVTPAMCASSRGNLSALRSMARRGADLAQRDREGKSAADWAYDPECRKAAASARESVPLPRAAGPTRS